MTLSSLLESEGCAAARNILVFGEILWDRLPEGEILGGAPFNFAYRSSALGDRVSIVSRLGTDGLGQRAWKALAESDMDGSLVQWDSQRATGIVDIEFDTDRVAKIYVRADAAYDHIGLTPEVLSAAEMADCVCFGTVAQRSAVSRKTLHHLLLKAPTALKVLDINLRDNCFTAETVFNAIEQADILKVNRQEAGMLSAMLGLRFSSLPEFTSSVIERWPLRAIVITLEEKGAFAVSAEGDKVYAPGYQVEMKDPLGTGDAFTAGFVHQYLRGKTLLESCRYGNTLGALVAIQVGATSPLSQKDIAQFLACPPSHSFDEYLSDCFTEGSSVCRS